MGKARSPRVHQNKTHLNTPNTSFRCIATVWPVPSNNFILLQHSAIRISPLINPAAVKEKKKMIFFSSASLHLLHGDIILLDAKVQIL